jgi:hypothetical protein
MAAPKTPAVVLLGSTSIRPAGAQGGGLPAGALHLVDGWDALCGGGRVRFVFPGRAVGDGTCPECLQARVPKPRPARTRSQQSGARAS